jgi:hypothetical protein
MDTDERRPSITQWQRLTRVRLSLVDEGIESCARGLAHAQKSIVPVSILLGETQERSRFSLRALLGVVGFGVLTVATAVAAGRGDSELAAPFILGAVCLGFVVAFIASFEKSVTFLDGTRSLTIHTNRPSTQLVDEFLDAGRDRARSELRQSILPRLLSGAPLGIRELRWLRSKQVISESEFAQLTRASLAASSATDVPN